VFNFSGSEIVFLLLLALIVLGPEKLPEAVRKFGKTYAEFKKMTTGFQSELKSALDEPMREMRETADAFKRAASFDFDAEPDEPEASGDTKPEIEQAPTVEPPATTSPATFSAAPPIREAPADNDEAPDEPAVVDEPIVTGLDAVIVRDAPVQGGASAGVPPERPATVPESPSIAAPVTPREPRKNTAASFRRAPKIDEPAEAASAAGDGSAPPMAPRPDEGSA
jgi:sec-independent protein translocase protein TatB